MARFDLGDEEWAAIRRHLPQQGRGPQRRDDRTVLNGIFHILRTGAPWCDLPGRYGSTHDHLQSLRSVGRTRDLATHP